jgi:glycosyltransferase involved in cell wall biosynthesis/O-antigen/teichoic acid export membrane protein
VTVPTQTDDPVGIDAAAATTGASVIRGGLWSLVSGLLPQMFTLVLSVAAARFLGPEAMGRQSFIAFVSLSATTVFASGLSNALMRSVAATLGARRPGDARGLVRWARRVQLAGALGGATVLLVPAVSGATPTAAWALAGVATALGILQTVPNAVLIGTQRFRAAAIVGLTTGGAAVPTMVLVLALGGGISGMFAVEVATVAANLLWTTALSRRALEELAPAAVRNDPALRRVTSRFALYNTAGGILSLVVWRRSEFFFLAHYSTDTEIALYSIAFAGAAVLGSITERLSGALSSAFATLHGAAAIERLRSGYARTLRLLFLLSLPAAALAAGGGPAAIRVVYGADYAGAGDVLYVLLLAIPMLPLWSVCGSLLAAVGDARSPLIASAAAATLNVALAVALVPRFDAVGAAVANVGGQAIAATLMFWFTRRRLGPLPVRRRTGSATRVLLASGVAGAATWAICAGLGGPAGLILGVGTGLAVLWALLAALRPLPADDALWLDEQIGGRVGAVARRLARGVAPAPGFRLAVYTDAAIVGGAEQSLGNLLARLDPAIDVVVLGAHEPTVRSLASRRPGTAVHVLPRIRGKLDVAGMATLALILRRLRPDILQVTLPTPWACRHAVVVGAFVPGVRVIAVEQLPTPAPDRWQRAVKRFASRRLAGHVSVGNAAAREIERVVGLRAGAVGVIHNGVEPSGGVRGDRSAGSPLRFGTLARLDPQKGIEDWLHALVELPAVHAEIVGDGPLRAELERLAAELGLDGRVTFTGWSAERREHLADWDAFVLPSHFEGFPLSIVEAMLQSVPVIATDVGSVGEAIVDGETGLLVPPRRPEALAAAARRLAEDPALSARLGERGRELALEQYTAAAMARSYEALYSRVLGRSEDP